MKTNLELYKVFYETARQQSVTAAAEALFITQPAVSQAIRHLEDMLNTTLFTRKPRGMELTKAGSVLFQYAEQAYALLEKGEQHLRQLHNLEKGEFIISAGDTICRHILLPVIERFHVQYPGIQVRVTNRTSPETARLLREGNADIGLLALPLDEPSLNVLPLFSVHDAFLCGKKHLEKLPVPAGLSDIQQHPLLLLESGTITRKTQEDQFLEKGLSLDAEIELGSLDLLVEFARIGMGIACVPREFFLEEIRNRTIYEISLAEPLVPRIFAAAWQKNIPLASASRKFLEFMQDQLRQQHLSIPPVPDDA
ncbi:MAG: LysR family transcriptional regulator [Spirochaetales bacterium]|nr:LysR family transcriptional regulator [Spirochaetales bacterium]